MRGLFSGWVGCGEGEEAGFTQGRGAGWRAGYGTWSGRGCWLVMVLGWRGMGADGFGIGEGSGEEGECGFTMLDVLMEISSQVLQGEW